MRFVRDNAGSFDNVNTGGGDGGAGQGGNDQPVRDLGEGGMGEVYRAKDTRLDALHRARESMGKRIH